MLISVCLLAAVFPVQDATVRRNGELVKRLYPVASFLREIPEPENTTRWGSHVMPASWSREDSAEANGENPFWPARDSVTPLQTEDLLALVRAQVTPSVWSQGDASMDAQSGALLVEAPTATQEELAKFLARLESALRSQEIFLRVDALAENASSLPSGSVLDASETQKLAARLDRESLSSWNAQGRVFTGTSFAASRRESQAFLQSYSVEVATKSKGTRPVIAQAMAGPAAILRPHVLTNGRMHLTYTLENSSLRALERFETRSQDAGSVQIPRIALTLFAGSAVLAPGESLLLRSSGALESAFWVRMEWNPRTPSPEEFTIFDPRVYLDNAGRSLPSLDEKLALRERDAMETGREAFSSDFLLQLLPAREGSAERSAWQRVSGGFFLRRAGTLSESVKMLEQSQTAPVLLELLLAKDAAGSQPLFQTQLLASPGRICGFLGGVESSHVAGYDIQIAQESTIAQPVLVPLFAGVQARARVLGRQESGAQIAVELATHAVVSAETQRSELSNSGDFVAASLRSAESLRHVDLPWGQLVSLGELGPFSEQTQKERIFAFLRARSAGK